MYQSPKWGLDADAALLDRNLAALRLLALERLDLGVDQGAHAHQHLHAGIAEVLEDRPFECVAHEGAQVRADAEAIARAEGPARLGCSFRLGFSACLSHFRLSVRSTVRIPRSSLALPGSNAAMVVGRPTWRRSVPTS